MNWFLIFKTLAVLLISISFTMVFPIIWSIYYQDNQVIVFFKSILFMLTTGCIMYIVGSLKNKKNMVGVRESYFIVGVGWILVSFFSALPLFFSGQFGGMANSFFEVASGYSTTGASILTNIESIPKSLLFWRSFTHFLGGMGFIVLTVAILPLLGIGGVNLYKQEVPGPIQDRITPKIADSAKALWYIYIGMFVLETVLLMFSGNNFYDSIIHAMGTVATGGFSDKNDSVAGLHSVVSEYVIIIFMLLSGVNFSLHYLFIKNRSIKTYFKSDEFRYYIGVIFVATVLVFFGVYSIYGSFEETFRKSLFHVVSIITTTGFATCDYLKWPAYTYWIIISLMFFGAMGGSTGGGIKIARIVIVLKFIKREFGKVLERRKLSFIFFENKSISVRTALNIQNFIFTYILITLVLTIIISMMGYDFVTSFSAVLACISNVGPGLGKVGPASNFNFFSDSAKWLLSFAMILGRLEIFTLLLLFLPNYWKKTH